MQNLVIRGGRTLSGTVGISGGKNAVLPMLAAAVLFRQPVRVENCPKLTDVETALEILKTLGASAQWDGRDILVDPRGICRWDIPGPLMSGMRGSVLFAGALLARFEICRLAQPGGCVLGERPVNFHREGFFHMGARQDPDDLEIWHGPLTGGTVVLPYPSVGTTENLILAALGASGTTILSGAAREPEIQCLCEFLRMGGCSICGDGTDTVTVEGGLPEMASMEPIPDRMEAATFACCTASAGGSVILNRCHPEHLAPVLEVLSKAGCEIRAIPDGVSVFAGDLESPGKVITGPYPEFPTDAQAPVMAALLRAKGITDLEETVFSHRFGHVGALRSMGAQIFRRGNRVQIMGVPVLTGACVEARDLRGGAALAVAALGAEGTTTITGLQHILRGYENFAGKLYALGADAFLT